MRTIGTIVMIFWSVISLSQIKNHGNIELGYKDGKSVIFYDKVNSCMFQYPANTLYADLNLDFTWKFIRFNQQLKNNFCYKQGHTFSPIDIEFISTLTFEYKKLAIGCMHSCLHPVISNKSDLDEMYRRGSEDRVFIRIKW
jgi:hypothetical protein